jgi:hypothetical protein
MRTRLLPKRPREGADNGANSVARAKSLADCDFNLAALHPAYRAENAGTRKASKSHKAGGNVSRKVGRLQKGSVH